MSYTEDTFNILKSYLWKCPEFAIAGYIALLGLQALGVVDLTGVVVWPLLGLSIGVGAIIYTVILIILWFVQSP